MISSQLVSRTVNSFLLSEGRIFSRTFVQPSPLRRLYIARIRDGRTFRTVVGKARGSQRKRSPGYSAKRRAHVKHKNKKSRRIAKADFHVRIT